MNFLAIKAIYRFEMARALRTVWQSVLSPVISTSLYFIVFGAAMGSRIGEISNVSYGAFIVPGLLMMSLLGQSVSNASFGIYKREFRSQRRHSLPFLDPCREGGRPGCL